MHLVLIVHSLRRGGAERVLLEIANELQNRGHQVEVISWLKVDEYNDDCYSTIKRYYLIEEDDYNWVSSIPKSAIILRKLLLNLKPNIIQIHTPNITWLTAFTFLRIPCIHVLHGYGDITPSKSLKNYIIRFIYRLASMYLNCTYITVSESMIPIASNFFNLNHQKFIAVKNGVDQTKFFFKEKTQNNNPIIVIIGTLTKNKGQIKGILAFLILLKYIPNAKLLIVGEGVDREKINNEIEKNKLFEKVKLLGRRDDIPKILANSNILWQLSESEAMPMVVLEAMASGTPVIGFDVRGTKDVVINNKTGYLVQFDDVSLIAKKTVDLLNSNDIYKSFSLNSQKIVADMYTKQYMIAGHENALYQKMKINNYES